MVELVEQGGPVSSRVDFPAQDAFAITPNDGADTGNARSLWVGNPGDVTVHTLNGAGVAVTFANVQAGSIIPVAVRRVLATGTTATAIVGLV